MSSIVLSENFLLQSQNPLTSLPPLWEVIYQEAMRGHHLLFRKNDVERFDAEAESNRFWENAEMSDELEVMVLKVIACAELSAMVKFVDELEQEARRNLYFMYKRTLGLWRCYVKDHMN